MLMQNECDSIALSNACWMLSYKVPFLPTTFACGKETIIVLPWKPHSHSWWEKTFEFAHGRDVSLYWLIQSFFILKVLLVSFEYTNSRFMCSPRIDILGMDKKAPEWKGNFILLVYKLVLVQLSEENVCQLETVSLWSEGVSPSCYGCMRQPKSTPNPIVLEFYEGFLQSSWPMIANSIFHPFPLFGGW